MAANIQTPARGSRLGQLLVLAAPLFAGGSFVALLALGYHLSQTPTVVDRAILGQVAQVHGTVATIAMRQQAQVLRQQAVLDDIETLKAIQQTQAATQQQIWQSLERLSRATHVPLADRLPQDSPLHE